MIKVYEPKVAYADNKCILIRYNENGIFNHVDIHLSKKDARKLIVDLQKALNKLEKLRKAVEALND